MKANLCKCLMQRVLLGVSVTLVVGSQVMPASQPAIWGSTVLHDSTIVGRSRGLPIANQAAAPATVGRSVTVEQSQLVNSSLLLNTYVALGDSYSSGESVQPFLPGTGTTPQACDRSKWAYPRILSKYLPYHLDFVACSGATTADVLSKGRFPGQPAQFYSLNPAKDALVTLTVGGDNLGFATIITKCIEQFIGPLSQSESCVHDPGFERSLLNKIYGYYKHPSIRVTLTHTFERIKAKVPRARIVVLDYPDFFSTSVSGVCLFDTELSGSDGSFFSKVVNILDQQESEAARAAGVSFLDVRRAFHGHGLCSSDPYVNGITFRGYLNDVGSFHPNASGQLAYAAALRAYLAKPAIQKTNGPMWPVVQCPTTGGGLAHLTPPPPASQLPAAPGFPASGVTIYVASSVHSNGPWIWVYAPSNEPCAALFQADGSGSITVGTAHSATYTSESFSTSMATSWNVFCGILPSSLTKWSFALS